ncbi:pirin family protein [Anaerosphaera multitolerans]|uniref:Pirin family protein n=2 Tax=Anaerosphaera multitolerans TaxID=2487351 RepID=A0A437S6Q6_9FIRM|nr:pirin family protein [Anaerosphaera multitolerans]
MEPVNLRIPVKSPFIIGVHHLDYYPEGNEKMEPTYYIEGREIGKDLDPKSPWRMYHGTTVPGFPSHPHRGFETVTIVEKGFVDHSDSFGLNGRYGNGDVQWLTAGSGIQHCEMFPLINQNSENTLELFQLWLNLPKENKLVQPYYNMLWSEDIPIIEEKDEKGKSFRVKVIAGDYKTKKALPPNPDSWAAEKQNHVVIWIIELDSNAEFVLRPTTESASRMIYYYKGDIISIESETIASGNAVELVSDEEIKILNGVAPSKILLLEGEPINEPISTYGPFVMNTKEEIMQAFNDYLLTQFGGWPWPTNAPLNPIDSERFAKYPNKTEYPKKNKLPDVVCSGC